jgi:hypothetical protein
MEKSNNELRTEIRINLSKLYMLYGRTQICIQKSLNKDSGITLGYILTENLFEKKRVYLNDLILQIIRKINDENDNYYFKITTEKMTSEEAFCYTLPYRMMENNYWFDELYNYLMNEFKGKENPLFSSLHHYFWSKIS